MSALSKANDIRSRRAQLKRDVKTGRVVVKTILSDPPEWIETMKVLELLLAMPKYGRVKAGKTVNQCRLSPAKTVGGMSRRQRAELCASL